jgi:6-phospho-beta-glucosidase
MRGEYPAYALKNWERKGYDIKMELEDAQILKKGCCDYVGFSDYMSNAVKADVVADGNGI